MSLSALQIYYYPGHWFQCLPAHTVTLVSLPRIGGRINLIYTIYNGLWLWPPEFPEIQDGAWTGSQSPIYLN